MTEVINGRLRMRGDRILLKPLEWDHGCKLIEVIRHGDPVRGVVVEIGEGIHPVSKRQKSRDGKSQTIHFSKHFRPTEVKVGDVVELGGLNIFDGKGYKFTEVIYNGELHIICTERDVACIRNDSFRPLDAEGCSLSQ